MARDELNELKKAIVGLEYPSESDAPFDLFRWGKATGAALEQVRARAGKGREIEEVPIETFFKQLAGSEDAKRFAELECAVIRNLRGAKIYRVGAGEVKVDVYILGKTNSGEWAGLHTVSVET
jgi:hypothetical protein